MSTTGYAYANLYRQVQFETEATENGIDYQYRIDCYIKYDNDLVDYYRSTKVSFAVADEIDLHENHTSVVFKKLAARIYKTRNSIVHSKESDKARYMPFRDDRMLVKEVPLLRFISEQIIINTSKVIE